MTTEPFEPVAPEPEPIPETVPVHPATATAGTARSTRTLVNGVLAIAFAVLIGGVAFAAGRATAPATVGADARIYQALQGGGGLPAGGGQAGPDGAGRFPGGFGGDDGLGRRGLGGSIQGTVVSISSSSITIKLADGQTVDIAVDSGTGYHRQADATAGDVTTGSTVVVNLGGIASNGRGSGPTASSITIVP